jgi:putative endonuclease
VGDGACQLCASRWTVLTQGWHGPFPTCHTIGRTVEGMSGAPDSADLSGREGQKCQSSDRRPGLGRLGEDLAAEHLARRGFQILERNFRTRWGELDIIARDGRTLVFCEVKTRRVGVAVAPFDALHPHKQAQVRRIARAWLANCGPRSYAPLLRFDAIGIIVDRLGALVALEHLEGAF